MLTVDLYWSFRSPYSYLATRRIVAMEAEYELNIRFRVVHPLAIRAPEFFERSNPLMQAYVAMDTRRVAEFLDIPFVWPQPDPVVVDATRRKFAVEQPYIFWLSRLGVEAARQSRGLAFANEVSQILWGGEVRNWHESDHLARAAHRAGLSLTNSKAQSMLVAQTMTLRSQTTTARLNVWGIGVFQLWYSRESRSSVRIEFEVCMWRMKKHGLVKRG